MKIELDKFDKIIWLFIFVFLFVASIINLINNWMKNRDLDLWGTIIVILISILGIWLFIDNLKPKKDKSNQ